MTMRILVSRTTTLPDPIKLARFLRAPELGPKVLFFTGGTALKALSRRIIDYTHNSIHLITPFDSGGSSAKLRAAFDMPAVGDLRNRLMALADR
ncbi:2-phospho-L-lactate transferase CofD family protein, partial [Desulfocurvibacter africanus]